jgi:3-oxoadipate enol-lactonase
MATLQVGDQALHYERRGTGEPLLMIMGIAATADYWGEDFLDRLAQRFDVIAYDHRGMGRSGRISADFTTADLADDAAGLLEALEIEPAHIIGFSLGGMVAQLLAVRRPAAVRRLVLGGTAASGRSALAPAMLRKLSEAIVSSDPEEAVQAGLEANLSPEGAGDADLRAAWIRMVSQARMPLRTIQRQLDALHAHDSTGQLASLTAPTLVVHGAEDQLVEPRHAQALANALPNATLAQIPHAGHMFFWEQHEISGTLISGWLEGNYPAGLKELEVGDVVNR